jgi:hypothetical protein
VTERFSDGFQTALTSSISTTSRPVTFNVSATSADLAGGTFSIIIYDSGTDANPVNAEILEVQDGSTTTWIASTESGHTAATHVSGSTVRLILTKRSLTQQMADHTNVSTTPDPHTQYVRKAAYTAKGDLVVGTASGAVTAVPVGTNGQNLVADSAQPSGVRWAAASGLSSVLTHMGDLLVGGILGAASRLGIGTVGQQLAVVLNSSVVANPTTAPTVTANATAGGSLSNAVNYDFAYAWSNGSSPDGGVTLPSTITSFTATSTGRVNVQVPAAPVAGLTLVVYAAVHSGTLQVQGTLPSASTSTTNTVIVSGIAAGAATSVTNTTGGVGMAWTTGGMVNPMTTSQDLIVGGASGAPARLGVGSAGQVLTVGSGPAILWSRAVDVMTSVGDLIIGGAAGIPARLAAGTSGNVLTSNGPGTSPSWSVPVSDSGNQSANNVKAGPSSGAAAPPGYRLLVLADIPALPESQITNLSTDLAAKVDKSTLTTKGDLYAATAASTPARLGVGTDGTVLTSDSSQTAGLRWATPTSGSSSGTGGTGGSIVPIQTQTPSGISSVTFAVPAGFKNLRITGTTRSNRAAANFDGISLQFNGDTGANYNSQAIGASGSTVIGSQSTAQTSLRVAEATAASSLANSAGSFEIIIQDHANTTFFKNAIGREVDIEGASATGTNEEFRSGFWANTAAVNSVTVLLLNGTFIAGSTITLWGEADTGPVLLTSNSNLIQRTVLTASQTTIPIPTIPQGYNDLRIVWQIRSTAAVTNTSFAIQFNGDTGSNYDRADVFGNTAAGAASAIATTSAVIGESSGASSPSGASGVGQLLIPNYAGQVFRKGGTGSSLLKSADSSGNIAAELWAIEWRNTAAITSALLSLGAGDFAVGTVIEVYGEPAAAAGASVGTGTRLRLSGNQSITTATATAITWDTEDQDADNQHYTSAANLTGTVAKTAASNALVGTGTAFTTELSIGQVISVPGTAAEVAVVIAITDATHLTVAGAGFANTASGQTATRVNSAVVFRQPGMFQVELGAYLAAVASGTVTVQIRLNGATMIGQADKAGVNASAGYDLVVNRPFQQWDYVEAIVTQGSGGSVNLLADERTHLAVNARPTVIVSAPSAVLAEQLSSGTDAGGFTQGSYVTRNLNTKLSDPAGIVAFDSTLHRFTIGPGTYQIRGSAPAAQVNRHKTRIYNVTDAVAAIQGTSEYATSTAGEPETRSVIDGDIVLTGTKTFEFQHQAGTTRATYGLGVASSATGTMAVADVETYAMLRITKVG